MAKQGTHGMVSRVQEPVSRPMQRVRYDKSHWSHKCGAMGALQTLSVIPIVAGDSLKVDLRGVFRLSPLRQNLYLDAVVDLFAFYVPHRHVYAANSAGSRWPDFLLAGQDEGITLGTDTLATSAGNNYNCFGFFFGSGDVVPKWATRPYVQIWNRYFRDPSDTSGILADDYFTGTPTTNEKNFGLKCAHIKRMWNSAINSDLTTADYQTTLAGGVLDLYDLELLKGRLKTETRRNWYDGARYDDFLKGTFDTSVNIDADQRPELIMRSRQWLSGYDVDGTDDATLGKYSGKAAGVMQLSFPRRLFAEHGTLWLMALLRFPPIPYNEWNPLVSMDEPTYAQISGDPEIIRRTTPGDLNLNQCLQSGPNVVVGKTPFAQWYREQPSVLHEFYQIVAGHPFINLNAVSTRAGAVYIDHDAYNECFQTLQLKHWNSQAFISVECDSFVPSVEDTIFAGTH